VAELVDAGLPLLDALGSEKRLCTPESLIADHNLLAIGQLVIFISGMSLLRLLHCRLKVTNDIAHSFLDVFHDFQLCCGLEIDILLLEETLEVSCHITTRQFELVDGVGNSKTFVNWHSVGNTVTRVEDATS